MEGVCLPFRRWMPTLVIYASPLTVYIIDSVCRADCFFVPTLGGVEGTWWSCDCNRLSTTVEIWQGNRMLFTSYSPGQCILTKITVNVLVLARRLVKMATGIDVILLKILMFLGLQLIIDYSACYFISMKTKSQFLRAKGDVLVVYDDVKQRKTAECVRWAGTEGHFLHKGNSKCFT